MRTHLTVLVVLFDTSLQMQAECLKAEDFFLKISSISYLEILFWGKLSLRKPSFYQAFACRFKMELVVVSHFHMSGWSRFLPQHHAWGSGRKAGTHQPLLCQLCIHQHNNLRCDLTIFSCSCVKEFFFSQEKLCITYVWTSWVRWGAVKLTEGHSEYHNIWVKYWKSYFTRWNWLC